MAKKKPFIVHVSETRHFEMEVWAADENRAREDGMELWRNAPVINQWELPPLPWSYETNARVGEHEGSGFVYLLDASGRKIGTVWGKPDEKLAIVELICDAADAKHRRGEQS